MTTLQKYHVNVVDSQDEYGGAHEYAANPCVGFVDGETKYTKDVVYVDFVKKSLDGDVTAGLTNEQLLAIMIDRTKKLNNKFPSREGALAITKMQEALFWTEARVQERIDRGVMGELKK